MNRPWEGITIARAVRSSGLGGRGGSRPLLGVIETGEVVHLKFQANPQSTMSLVNDWIGTQIGYALGVPVPTPLLVAVEFSDLTNFPILRGRRWRPGLQFATLWVPNCRPLNLPWTPQTMPANHEHIPLIALFELWLDNHDLKQSHLHLYDRDQEARLLVTDHGYILGGPRWSPGGLRASRYEVPRLGILDHLVAGLRVSVTCQDALTRMRVISRGDLVSLLRSVPAEWGLSLSYQNALLDFLLARLDRLPSMARRLEQRWASLGDRAKVKTG